jgi:hypothetical protein
MSVAGKPSLPFEGASAEDLIGQLDGVLEPEDGLPEHRIETLTTGAYSSAYRLTRAFLRDDRGRKRFWAEPHVIIKTSFVDAITTGFDEAVTGNPSIADALRPGQDPHALCQDWFRAQPAPVRADPESWGMPWTARAARALSGAGVLSPRVYHLRKDNQANALSFFVHVVAVPHEGRERRDRAVAWGVALCAACGLVHEGLVRRGHGPQASHALRVFKTALQLWDTAMQQNAGAGGANTRMPLRDCAEGRPELLAYLSRRGTGETPALEERQPEPEPPKAENAAPKRVGMRKTSVEALEARLAETRVSETRRAMDAYKSYDEQLKTAQLRLLELQALRDAARRTYIAAAGTEEAVPDLRKMLAGIGMTEDCLVRHNGRDCVYMDTDVFPSHIEETFTRRPCIRAVFEWLGRARKNLHVAAVIDFPAMLGLPGNADTLQGDYLYGPSEYGYNPHYRYFNCSGGAFAMAAAIARDNAAQALMTIKANLSTLNGMDNAVMRSWEWTLQEIKNGGADTSALFLASRKIAKDSDMTYGKLLTGKASPATAGETAFAGNVSELEVRERQRVMEQIQRAREATGRSTA